MLAVREFVACYGSCKMWMSRSVVDWQTETRSECNAGTTAHSCRHE